MSSILKYDWWCIVEINLIIISDSPGSQNSVLDNVQKTYTV